jgi:SHS2 domain-containing protein
MKEFNYLPHTADIRMKLRADSIFELFQAGLEGMNDILKEGECHQLRKLTIKKEFQLKSSDVTTLLIEFMGEMLTLTHTCRALFCSLHPERLTEREIVGYVLGIEVFELDEDIKAVTYHEANVHMNTQGQFETIIVFDI